MAKLSEKAFKNAARRLPFVGRAQRRYKMLFSRSFAEVEASELLHSMSFQSEIEDTGADSKGNKRFDRFAVMSPCAHFDPKREFQLKFTWSENALHIARKALMAIQVPDFGA